MKNKNMTILLIILVVVMLGYGIVMPVLPFFIDSLGGTGVHYGLLIACYGIMQLIFAPVWGTLSDKYGRKPLLLAGMVGLGLAMVLFALSTQLWMLYAAQLLSGGISSATLPAAQAYAADITSKEDRGGAMGKIGGAIGLGVVLGPGIGGLLASKSLATPFLAASGFCMLTCIIIMVGLPESLLKENRSVFIKIKFMHFKELGRVLFSPIGFGLVTVFVAIFGQTIISSVFGLYVMARFNYGPEQVGTFLMVMALMYALAQGLVVGPIIKKFGEEKVIPLAFLGCAVGFVLILIASAYVTIMMAISFFTMFNSLLKPSALSLISRQTVGNQGQIMGVAESYMSLGRIAGPLWGGMIFDINLSFPFISGAAFFIITFLVTLRRIKVTLETEQEQGNSACLKISNKYPI